MSDTVSRKALIDCLKKEAELCIKEKFNENKTRFYLGRETALTDIIRQIESGRFDTLSAPEGEIESLKAITELAVKGLSEAKIALKHTASLAHLPSCTCPPCNAIGFVEYTLSEIERLQNE